MTEELFSSESVASGHPDKLCDAISDAIVDACLAVDKNARVAVETSVKGGPEKGIILLAGEVTLAGEHPDYEGIARELQQKLAMIHTKSDSIQPQKIDVKSFKESQHKQLIFPKV